MDIFGRLAPYIQDFVYRNNWTEFREVQSASCDVIFNTDDHLLLTAGTASGKTEAAFLPALTVLYESPADSVGILYISPLKALINDQFVRLNALLKEGNIPVYKWHGDSAISEKTRLLNNPQGVLQITPESLESLMINKRRDCIRLFKDLRFVVIDEVHSFMASPRGIQLICLLERIERLTKRAPDKGSRRIGLSATLSDYGSATGWLCSGTSRGCQVPEVDGGSRKLALFMERFVLSGEGAIVAGTTTDVPAIIAAEQAPERQGQETEQGSEKKTDSELVRFYEFLYKYSYNKQTIIFANSRSSVESAITNLRIIAAARRTEDVYRVHHGSISAALRESTEKEMKESDLPIVTGATVNLELGIDIGSLDRIIQIGSPHSVSSLTQRIGRCGRKGQRAELIFAFLDREPVQPNTINWEFLKNLAIIQLRLEDKWVEPIAPASHSFGLLYHQTMSFLLAQEEASPALLAQNVLSLSAFQKIEAEDYKILLRHLLAIGHLQKTERGHLIIGYDAEPIVTGYQFYSVFETAIEYSVRCKGETIGSVTKAYPVGTTFALAGRAWKTVDVNEKSKIIFVTEARSAADGKWQSPSRMEIHIGVLQKIRHILSCDDEYAYLSDSCKARLAQIRKDARLRGITDGLVVPLGRYRRGSKPFAIFPWVGTRQLYTLQLILEQEGLKSVITPGGFLPVCLETAFKGTKNALLSIIKNALNSKLDVHSFRLPDDSEIPSKFNEFIPPELLRKEFIEDYVDVEGLREGINEK
ncbi:MAG: DEAD/DEAH box helicase [Spirochaetaceae bacterium]|jgi:ATP-dependent Lhr-like helicase|nr:DEAD/DEAH box helicase [Spirochaetaceae bacterium]